MKSRLSLFGGQNWSLLNPLVHPAFFFISVANFVQCLFRKKNNNCLSHQADLHSRIYHWLLLYKENLIILSKYFGGKSRSKWLINIFYWFPIKSLKKSKNKPGHLLSIFLNSSETLSKCCRECFQDIFNNLLQGYQYEWG